MTGHTYEILLALGVLFPMISFWLLVFFGPRLGKPMAGWVAVVLGMGVSLVLATIVLVGWWWGETEATRAALTEGAYRFHWADLGTVPVTVGIKLDSLTVAMFFMVAIVAFLIFLFSIGYMSGHSDEIDGKSKYSRFFAYLSLFGFSMLGLVVSSSLLFLFICWELVGLCSYLLIGFYFDRAYASAAAIKAFITNRVGDFGFLVGLMLVFFMLGTLDLDQAAVTFELAAHEAHAAPAAGYTQFTTEWLAANPEMVPQIEAQLAKAATLFTSPFTLFGVGIATILGIGLFCGAMGKSAQFPLHVWLPDAMAGPTPVSALIHAATMVAAGVYLVARVYRLMTPDALMFVAIIGCLTLTLMALVAIVQTDIKKCLAYSTLSQLGYMVFGMGCGAWIAALFHLITHAFFKAMLFLCSGQVIEGCHHEQDMRKMGGLRRKMPWTCWTFFIGVLAISGAGIPWLGIGLGGYYSKDEILAVAWARSHEWGEDDYHRHEAHEGEGGGHASLIERNEPSIRLAAFRQHGAQGQHRTESAEHPAAGSSHDEHHGSAQGKAGIFANMNPLPKWMFWLAIITAYITPFYMMRAWWMTFMGKPRDEHVYKHAHEIPLMYVPLIILAIGTCVASWEGLFPFRSLIAEGAGPATDAAMVMTLDGHAESGAMHAAHGWLGAGVGFAFLVGFLVAWLIYRRGLEQAEAAKRMRILAPLHLLLEKKYFFDEAYDFLWVRGCILVSRIVRFFDMKFVDLIFDLAALGTARLASFSGMILDNHGVDGVVNGIAKTSTDIGHVVRTPQTGQVRNYVLIVAGVAAAVIIGVLLFVSQDGSTVAAAATAPVG